MKIALPSLYGIKKGLLLPRTWFLRRRENLAPGFLRSAIELHYYRPTFYRWLAAVAENPALLYEHHLTEKSVVLDVGAYTGQWSAEVLKRYGSKIYAFEPDPRNFKRLQETAVSHSTLIPIEYGLGSRDETVSMALQFMGSNVILDPSAPTEAKQASVAIKDVVSVWQYLQLATVDLMKINIEGGEFPLLERMIEVGLQSRVTCFLIQFHEWHPGAYRRRAKIRRALSKTHKLQWDYHFLWEKWVKH